LFGFERYLYYLLQYLADEPVDVMSCHGLTESIIRCIAGFDTTLVSLFPNEDVLTKEIES